MASKRMVSLMEPLQLSKVKNREVSPLARGKSPATRVVQVTPLQQHQIGTYLLEKCLGAGAYGEVYKASHLKTKDQVAVKKMEKAPEIYPEVVRETDIIYTIGTHPYCVKFLDKIETEDHVFLVMSFAQGGDLYEFVFPEKPAKVGESLPRSLDEEKSLKLFCKILVGLEHVHKKNIVHGDIKLENIFLQKDGEPQIGDFGLARYFEPGTKTYYAQGTLHYCAPESILQKDIEGPEVDIWSMGIMLYIMLFGRYPFYGATEVDVLRAIAYGPLRLNFKGAGPETCDLLRCILKKEPEKRATIAAIKAHRAVKAIFAEIEAEMDSNPSMVVREASILFGDDITTARREMTPTRGMGTAPPSRKLGLLVDKKGRALDDRGRKLDDGRGRKRKNGKSPREKTKSKSRSRSRSRGRSKSITRGRSKSVTKPSTKTPLSASLDVSSPSNISFSSVRTTSFDEDVRERSPRKSLSKSPRSRREVKKVKRVATDDAMHRSSLFKASGSNVAFESSGESLNFFNDVSPTGNKSSAVEKAAELVRLIESKKSRDSDSDEAPVETTADEEAATPETEEESVVQRMKSPDIVPKLNMGALPGLVAEATSAHSSRSMTVRGFMPDSPFLPTPKSRKIDLETLIKGRELVRAPVASLAPPKDMDSVPLHTPTKRMTMAATGTAAAVAVTPPMTPRDEEASPHAPQPNPNQTEA